MLYERTYTHDMYMYNMFTNMYTSSLVVLTCTQVHWLYSHVHKFIGCTNTCTSSLVVLTCTQVHWLYSHVHKFIGCTHMYTSTM